MGVMPVKKLFKSKKSRKTCGNPFTRLQGLQHNESLRHHVKKSPT